MSKRLVVTFAVTMLFTVVLLAGKSVFAKNSNSDGVIKSDKEINITFKYVNNQDVDATETEEIYVVNYEKKTNIDEPVECGKVVSKTTYLPD